MKKRNDIHIQAVKALEEHGHLFQQRCRAEIGYHCLDNFSLQSEEYPVSIGEEETVIDFVLSSKKVQGFHLVFECKRANPDYVTWLFPISSDAIDQAVPKCLLTMLDAHGRLQTAEHDILSVEPKHFVTTGIEMSERSSRKGKTSRTETIWSACQQVLTGVGGLALEQRNGMHRIRQHQQHHYLPVVVTTARLYITRYRVWKVDLKTGKLSGLPAAETLSADWVIYDFPVRGPLQVTTPEFSSFEDYGPSEEYRRKFKVKSVAIVNSDSIARFLNFLKHPER